jgi:hypothetical protein
MPPRNPLDPADFNLKVREIIGNQVIIDIEGNGTVCYPTQDPTTKTKGCQPTTRKIVRGLFVQGKTGKAQLFLEASPRAVVTDKHLGRFKPTGGGRKPK